jgi:hypothetical protein
MHVRITTVADALGTIGAAICTLHCLATPIGLVAGSLLPSVLLPDESFHRAMLWLVVPTSLAALSLGCRRHKDRRTLVLGAAGVLGLLLAGALLHGTLGEVGEKIVTLLAAPALIAGHVRNFRLCAADDCDHESAATYGGRSRRS